MSFDAKDWAVAGAFILALLMIGAGSLMRAAAEKNAPKPSCPCSTSCPCSAPAKPILNPVYDQGIPGLPIHPDSNAMAR